VPASDERTDEDETRRFYPWKLNELEPDGDLHYSEIDGVERFRELFEVPRAGGDPRDDLQVYRFGRWGGVVGRELAGMDVGEPSDLEIELLDKDGDPVGPDHFRVDFGQDVLPVYVRGEVHGQIGASTDVVIAVNGFVAGWGETYLDKGTTEWFSLTPQQLYADGDNDLQLYEIRGEPSDPELHPIAIEWEDQ
jgi:hypothetical protein